MLATRTADADDSATQLLTYPAVLHDAQTVAPSIALERARSSAVASSVGVAGMLVNPYATIGTTAQGARFYSTLTIPLPITRRSSAIEAAQSASTAAAAEVPVFQLDARLAAANAWSDLWLAERYLDLARDNAGRATTLHTVAKQRYDDGSGALLDEARASAEEARSRAEVKARTELIASASAALAYWLGRDPTVALHTNATPPSTTQLPSLSALMSRLPSHPVYARSAARKRAATAAVGAQRGRAWPSFGVQVGATLFDENAPMNNVSAAVMLDIPVFNQNGAAITQAERGVVQVAAESNAFAVRLQADLVSAYATLEAAIARAEASENEVLPTARRAADLTRDAYKIGAIDLSAVLVAERALADAKLAAFDAIAQRSRALAALEHALGGSI